MDGSGTDGGIEDFLPLRATIDCPGGGRVLTLGTPGLAIDHRGQSWIEPRGIDEMLDALAGRRTSVFLLLMRDEDCPEGYRLMLRQRVKQAGMAFVALPIDDFSTPGRAWMRAWRRVSGQAFAQLAADRAIALCCSYGAGRSGMIAAYILHQLGLSVEGALFKVRSQFPESVESPAQEAWLHTQSKGGRSAAKTSEGAKA